MVKLTEFEESNVAAGKLFEEVPVLPNDDLWERVAEILVVAYAKEELLRFIDRRFPNLTRDGSERFCRVLKSKRANNGPKVRWVQFDVNNGENDENPVDSFRFKIIDPGGAEDPMAPYRMILNRAKLKQRITEVQLTKVMDMIAVELMK